MAFDPVLAGTVTESEALPPVHETVFGNPETAGDEENTQFVVPVTDAESVTDPPACGSVVGVALNDVTLGGRTNGFARGASDDDAVFEEGPGAAEAIAGTTMATLATTTRLATADIVSRRHVEPRPPPPPTETSRRQAPRLPIQYWALFL